MFRHPALRSASGMLVGLTAPVVLTDDARAERDRGSYASGYVIVCSVPSQSTPGRRFR